MTDSPEGVDGARSAGSRIAVIDKAVRTLDALVAARNGLTPTEVAESIGTNRSTAFRLLTSLEQTGLLSRDPETGKYRLGIKMLQYGAAVRLGMNIVQTAEPTLMTLRDDTRQTALLAIREEWGARCLMRLPGPDVDVLSWTTGQWLPLHAAAAPQALMGAMSDDEVARYLAYRQDRPAQRCHRTDDEIREIIDEIRRRGWAVNTATATQGVASLGTVVRDRDGDAVCAISVAGLEHHYTGTSLDQTAARVMAAAEDIGRRLRE